MRTVHKLLLRLSMPRSLMSTTHPNYLRQNSVNNTLKATKTVAQAWSDYASQLSSVEYHQEKHAITTKNLEEAKGRLARTRIALSEAIDVLVSSAIKT